MVIIWGKNVGDMLMAVFNKYYFVSNISQVLWETLGQDYIFPTLMDIKCYWDVDNDK